MLLIVGVRAEGDCQDYEHCDAEQLSHDSPSAAGDSIRDEILFSEYGDA